MHGRLSVARVLCVAVLALLMASCGGETEKVFYIGGIPDQEVSRLETRFNGLADYLTDETGVTVKYIPSIDYAAVVTAFKQGDVEMGWFGGLTGVQARLAVPDAQAIAQRPRDAAFHSVFVADPALNLASLEDVRGRTLTLGSVSSTSGHLMPRFFLAETGVNVDDGLKGPLNFSGSHDKTWKLVEAGTFDVGALNEAVWETRVAAGDVDLAKVDVFFTTPAYYDYHWVIGGDVDAEFGPGTAQQFQDALLRISIDEGPRERVIAEAFQTEGFIPTSNENYEAIEQVARQLGIVE